VSHLRGENILPGFTGRVFHRPLYPDLLRLRISRFKKSENDQATLMPMANPQSPKDLGHVWRDRPIWDQSPEELARTMIQIFGVAAAGKAIEMTRMQTEACNRAAAVKWHRVMSLIEETLRKLP
jgi:hypothetical protein